MANVHLLEYEALLSQANRLIRREKENNNGEIIANNGYFWLIKYDKWIDFLKSEHEYISICDMNVRNRTMYDLPIRITVEDNNNTDDIQLCCVK